MSTRYNNYSSFLKEKFGCRVAKISIDAGMTCPNRDGNISTEGCIFCSARGSGDFTPDKALTIKEQIKKGINLIKDKWPNAKYIIYFQAYTNTYANIDFLKQIYYEALSFEGVVGLSIATRPDCLNKEVLSLLDDLNKKTFLTIELGLQTIHEKTATIINRGYSLDVFEEALNNLNNLNINVVTHVILSLPGESDEDYMETIKYLSGKNIHGIKFHMLHILKNTKLHSYYNKTNFKVLTKKEYVTLVCDSLEILNESLVIHRLTGDGPKDLLIEPKWTLYKRSVLNDINMELKARNTCQGTNYNVQ